MPICINCPSCQTTFNLPDRLRHKTVRCSNCQTPFVVTAPPPEPLDVVPGALFPAPSALPEKIAPKNLPATPRHRSKEAAPSNPRLVKPHPAPPQNQIDTGLLIGAGFGFLSLFCICGIGVSGWIMLRSLPGLASGEVTARKPLDGLAQVDLKVPSRYEPPKFDANEPPTPDPPREPGGVGTQRADDNQRRTEREDKKRPQPTATSPATSPSSSSDPVKREANAPAPSPTAKEWYAPKEADFRPEYDRDSANRARESWQEYWSWVTQFYEGNFLSTGWTVQSKGLLEVVKSEQTRDELRATLNDVGRRVAAEWSKDNGLRKIDTANLRTFGRRLQEAKEHDDGSGRSIRTTLDALRSEVEAKLTRR
jgi:hypothetical protein